MSDDLMYVCDACHEQCWADWSVRLEINRQDEAIEVVICDSCLGELYEQCGGGAQRVQVGR